MAAVEADTPDDDAGNVMSDLSSRRDMVQHMPGSSGFSGLAMLPFFMAHRRRSAAAMAVVTAVAMRPLTSFVLELNKEYAEIPAYFWRSLA